MGLESGYQRTDLLQSSHNKQNPVCLFCKRAKRSSHFCTAITDYLVKKTNIVKKGYLCFNCLGHHKISQCINIVLLSIQSIAKLDQQTRSHACTSSTVNSDLQFSLSTNYYLKTALSRGESQTAQQSKSSTDHLDHHILTSIPGRIYCQIISSVRRKPTLCSTSSDTTQIS